MLDLYDNSLLLLDKGESHVRVSCDWVAVQLFAPFVCISILGDSWAVGIEWADEFVAANWKSLSIPHFCLPFDVTINNVSNGWNNWSALLR